MNRDYFQEALHKFNTDKPNWYGWKKVDGDEIGRASCRERV